ncbi:hypothetical protein P8452_48552 [Trifolium repens]|nr:hypothetical protein P8452_48552 [Trifolium repens]
MKINYLLAIIGVCYSYCLIILRSSFSTLNVIPEPQCLELEEQRVVIQVDFQQEDTDSGCIKQHSHTSFEPLLQQFQTCMKELEQNNSNIAKMLIENVKGNYKLVVTDHNFITDALPHETINNIQNSAKLMVDAGFEKVCFEVYNGYRKEWLEDLLGKMRFQDYVIGKWIKTSEVALRVLFPSERRLYNCVFSNSMSPSSDLYFTELCRGSITKLLNFADSFANQSPSAWRLFKILDLFETLCNLIPEFESLFIDSLVNEAIKVKNRLGEISRDIFMEFGNLIFLTPDAEFDCWADGGVHPMTSAATGYIVMAFWSRQNLEQILQQYPLVDDDRAETSLFYSQMVLIMEQFESKLEAKSQIYGDPALRYFFMMNNLGHVTYRLETFWDHRFGTNVEQYFELYCRNSWNMVINVLKMDMNESVAPNSETDSMKDKLNIFNQKFREMCGIQSTWRVLNEQVRNFIITSIESILLPAYENFIGMYHNTVGKNVDEYIEYGIFDIKNHLSRSFILQDVDSVKGLDENQLVS